MMLPAGPPPETSVYMDWTKDLVAWLVTLGGAAYTAWKTAQRRERARGGVYAAHPDDTQRINRRIADTVRNHAWKWEVLERENSRRDRELQELRVDFDRHLQESADAMQNLVRLEERVKNSLEQWERSDERAQEDRKANDRRLDTLTGLVEVLREELHQLSVGRPPKSERS